MKILSSHKVFDGDLKQYQHISKSTKTAMKFSIFTPAIIAQKSVPVVYWLSGLTCSDENFCQKAGAFQKASELGLCLVMPDTSPRGLSLPGEYDSYDFGSGAGFYVDATQAPWSNHYCMYTYVSEELPNCIESNFNVTKRRSIFGHSMGGHGALVIAFRNSQRYESVSAFSPIVHPVDTPWGEKAFSNYLGEKDKTLWHCYDAVSLIRDVERKIPVLIDQGTDDEFLHEQLKPKLLEQAANAINYPIQLNIRAGYDHSYYFISSFIDQHLEFHSNVLI